MIKIIIIFIVRKNLNFIIQNKIDEYKKFDRNLKKDFDKITQLKR